MTKILNTPDNCLHLFDDNENVNLIMMIVKSPGNCLHLFDLRLNGVVGSSKPLNHLATFLHLAFSDQDVRLVIL